MNYKEFMDTHKDVIGKTVWICDYRFNNVLEKPIRHIKPTKVEIFDNFDLPKHKTVYYSTIHFRPYGKKGQPLKQIIAPFDNTGFRSCTGVSLNIFLTEEECIEHYLNQCQKIRKDIQSEWKSVENTFHEKLMSVTQEMYDLTK